jgi:hypothetical protein
MIPYIYWILVEFVNRSKPDTLYISTTQNPYSGTSEFVDGLSITLMITKMAFF